MAEATAIPTSTVVWDDGHMVHVVGTMAIGASPATYAAGGIACDILANMVDGAGLGIPLPGISLQPIRVTVDGIAGYKYEWKASTKKLLIRLAAVAGTIVSTFTLKGGGLGTGIGYSADAADFTIGKAAATDRTSVNVVASVLTGTAAAMAEIATAAVPAAVSNDVISFYAIFKKML